VAVLDIRMPRLNGIDIVRNAKSLAPDTRSLVLTAYDDDEYVLALMEMGVSGYLLKTARASELVDAIRTVYGGEPVLHSSIAAKVARLWVRRQQGRVGQGPEQLTPRELEVLEHAAQGARNKGIADSLGISVRTVEGHFNSILSKLGVGSRIEAVLYAVSHHWVALDEATRQRGSDS
jgi:DNA-binding NarL/FixJ family response regulator